MPELNLFSIPAGAPFLEVLAQAMLDGRLGPVHDPADPAAMARTTLYLPTRRAARAFAAILAGKLGGKPLLLPRIVPLGGLGEVGRNMTVFELNGKLLFQLLNAGRDIGLCAAQPFCCLGDALRFCHLNEDLECAVVHIFLLNTIIMLILPSLKEMVSLRHR